MRSIELNGASAELLPELLEDEMLEEDEFEGLDESLGSSDADLELDDEELDEERRRLRRLVRRRPRPSRIPKRLRRLRPRGVVRPVLRRKVVVRRSEPCICPARTCPAHGSEYIRWVQSALNQRMGLNLRVNGVMNPATRDALRQFQQQQGLPSDGIAGPDTKRALLDATGGGARDAAASTAKSTDSTDTLEPAADSELFEFDAESSPSSNLNIVDRTAYTPKDKRKKVRKIDEVYALVLHQSGFSRGNDTTRYDKVTGHFAILPNGTILQLHPLTAYLYASNGFNKGSVAVEFIGNFPSTNGRCYKPERFGCHQVTAEQIQAGRGLVQHLMKTIGLTHVLAHRQSSGSRGNDPGPDIWYRVGQWAVNQHGLKDGGPGFKVQSGKAIPDSWRGWNR